MRRGSAQQGRPLQSRVACLMKYQRCVEIRLVRAERRFNIFAVT